MPTRDSRKTKIRRRPPRRRRWPLRRRHPLVLVPFVVVAATLASGSWWNPLDWEGFVDGIVEGMGEALVWLLNLAFNNPLTVISTSEWQAAFGQAAKWGGVFAVVAVAICAVEIIAGMISSDHGRILRGWVWAILAWPLTAASLLVYSRMVNASDWLTTAILNSITAPEVVAGSAVATGATSAATTAMVSMLLGVSALSTWWLALIFVGLAMLPVIGLVIVLGAVTFGQIALAGFAPVALMLIGFRGTRPMSSKWLQMAVALLLTKPIAAGIVALGCALGSQGGADGLILGIIAITVAVASPALAFSFVGFAGAQLGGAITAHADKIKGLSNSLAHAGANQGIAALRERLGGSAKDAAAIAGAGVGAGAGAGFGGFGSTTAGAESTRPSAGDPHSTAPAMAAGPGDRRSSGRRGMNGPGKNPGTGKTSNGAARSSSGPVLHSNAADPQAGRSSSRTGAAAGSGFADPVGHDEARGDRDSVSLLDDGWQGDAVPTVPDEGGLEHGDVVSGLGGPVGEAAWLPVGHDGSSGSTVQPLEPAEEAGAARSCARETASATGGASPSPSDSGTSMSGSRHDTPSAPGLPAGGATHRRAGAEGVGTSRGTTPGSAESRTGHDPTTSGTPTRADARPVHTAPNPEQPHEPQRPARPSSGTSRTPDPAPPAEPANESGPNPFGGTR